MFIGTSLGIELAGKDLRVAVIRGRFRKLRLVRLDELAGFADLPPDEQKASLLKLIKKHKLPSNRVFLTLPRDRGIVRQIEFPAEIQNKLKSAVALQVEALCPWSIDEVYWDFAYQEPKSGTKTIIVTVVVIPRASLDPWIDFFKSLKVPLRGASLSSTVCAHTVRSLWPDGNPTVILDCEQGYVEAALVHGARLTSLRQAGEDTTAAARTAVEQLISMGRIGEPDQARVLIYGPGAGSFEEAEPVRLPIENAPSDASRRFGAVASAFSSIKRTGFDCNLIPKELRFRRSQLQLVPTYILVLLAILLGSAMMLRESYQSTVYAAKLEREIRLVAPQVREVSSQAAELDRLAQRYKALLANFQNKDFSLEALRELAVSLPANAWLTSSSYQDGVVTIMGSAPSAAEVQKVLEDTALFKDVQLTSSVSRDAEGKERFSLRATVEVPR